MMIVTAYNTKGGVGKTTFLQQFVLPAIYQATGERGVYIDTDHANAGSMLVEDSALIEGIIRIRITDDLDSVAQVLYSLHSEGKFVIIDVPAVLENVMYLLVLVKEMGLKIFVPVTSLSSEAENLNEVRVSLSSIGVPFRVVCRGGQIQTSSDVIWVPDLKLVLPFAEKKKRTLWELAHEAHENTVSPVDRGYVSLIKTVFLPKIEAVFPQIISFLFGGEK